MKNRKEKKKKELGKKRRKYCVGLNPIYGILVTSTITGPGGSVVSALVDQSPVSVGSAKQVLIFSSFKKKKVKVHSSSPVHRLLTAL